MSTGREERAAALRTLFQQESTKRLERMATDLLALEQALQRGSQLDQQIVASVFRDAHTIKGSAAMMRFEPVVTLAHAAEDVLEEVRAGTRVLTPPLVTALLRVADELRAVTDGVLAGTDVQGRADAAAEAMRTAAGPLTPRGLTPAHPPGASTADPPARADVEETLAVRVTLLDDLVRLVADAASAAVLVGRVLRGQGVVAEDQPEFRVLTQSLRALQEGTTRTRMVPVSDLSGQLHRAARDLATGLGKKLTWELRGGDTEVDRSLLGGLVEVLLHLVRNAVDHGLETTHERVAAGKDPVGRIRLHAMRLGSEIVLTVSDDGRGLDLDALRRAAGPGGEQLGAADLAFRPGLSTAPEVTDVSGRGVGLDAVRHALDAARGRVEVSSTSGVGTEFRVILPISLSLVRCLLLRCGTQELAVALSATVVTVPSTTVVRGPGGGPVVVVGGHAVPVTGLGVVLGLPEDGGSTVLVLTGSGRRHAVIVDELCGQREVVVTALPSFLPRLPVYAGASPADDGGVLLVLDPTGLIAAAERVAPAFVDPTPAGTAARHVLVVDDAALVRELQRSILERAGYRVSTAGDGQEGLEVLESVRPDLVLTDVEMPRLDGIGLVEQIRAHPRLSNTAVVILTSRASESDRQRGLDAGADGYVVKATFDETALLATVRRLIGGPT